MTPEILVGLVVTGALGALARFVVDRLVQDRTGAGFPWGTLVVNVTGSLLVGLVTGAALYHALPKTPATWLAVGCCGSYTTFSTSPLRPSGCWRSTRHLAPYSMLSARCWRAPRPAAAGLLLAAAV